VAVLANHGFVTDAISAVSGKGIPKVRVIGESVPCECTIEKDIEAGVKAALDDIIAALTKPLTNEEKSPTPMQAEKSTGVIFKGNLEEVNRFFYQRGWTDGLPIIPPTEEAVAEMMTGTDLSPDHVVAKIVPRMGKATVRKIAINAVMSGALPTYMPILIAATEALADNKARFDMYEVSTGSWAPFWMINGPIRNDVMINCSTGSLSPGDMANAAIGRTMGLIVKNIGGARKAIEDMGVIGNPGKYTMVIGEHEEESPWEPFHVERGYNKEDSTVAVYFPNNFYQTIPMQTNAKGIADTLVNMLYGGGMVGYVLIPSHAKILASEGWTKRKLKEYIAEHAFSKRVSDAPASPPGQDRGPQVWEPRRMITDLENLVIFVAGGPGAFMAVLTAVGGVGNLGSFFTTDFVLKKIELPANWSKLVTKYKKVVPTHLRY
jgi:hypothetical protein